jgi:hypothetical protein
MEVTQLQHPSALMGDSSHARQVVDYHSANSLAGRLRNVFQRFFPTSESFGPRKQYGIQEHGVIALTGFQRHQIQHPWFALELEPQSVGQEHQRSQRYGLRAGSGYKTLECFPEAISIGGQRQGGAPSRQLAKRETVLEDPAKDCGRVAMNWATTFLRPNGPCTSALHTLSAAPSKPANSCSTTGGFRMFEVHACELTHKTAGFPRKNAALPHSPSTEFLYPSPECRSQIGSGGKMIIQRHHKSAFCNRCKDSSRY